MANVGNPFHPGLGRLSSHVAQAIICPLKGDLDHHSLGIEFNPSSKVMYSSSVCICIDTCICGSLQGFQHTEDSQTAKLSPREQQPSELNTGKSPQIACSQKTQQQQQNGGFISKEWSSSIPFIATTPRLEPALLAQHHGLFTRQKCSWGC